MGNAGKEVDNAVGKVLVAIQGIYFLLFGMANSSDNLATNMTPWLIGWAVVSPIVGYELATGIRTIKRNQALLKTNSKNIKLLLIPTLLGIAIMSLGIYFAALYQTQQTIIPGSGTFITYYHPYSQQGLLILMAGLAVEFITLYAYSKILPKLPAPSLPQPSQL